MPFAARFTLAFAALFVPVVVLLTVLVILNHGRNDE